MKSCKRLGEIYFVHNATLGEINIYKTDQVKTQEKDNINISRALLTACQIAEFKDYYYYFPSLFK